MNPGQGSFTIQPEGSKDCKIAIIGEAAGSYEVNARRPFVGPSGTILETCLHSAGLIRSDVYMTTFIKERVPGNYLGAWYNEKSKKLTEKGHAAAKLLSEELQDLKANVLMPMGNAAKCALLGGGNIIKDRGYAAPAILEGIVGRKVIPTLHPSASMQGKYIYRYYITHDFKKAKVECEYPELRFPERVLTYRMSFAEAIKWLEFYEHEPIFAFDIEVINYQVSCISFARSPSEAISIPIYQQWSESEEIEIWRRLARVLENPDSIKVLQNGIFDCWFLAMQCNIIVKGEIRDTMIAHHMMYPDMLKGLGFLGSIYTFERNWKSEVNWNDSKKES